MLIDKIALMNDFGEDPNPQNVEYKLGKISDPNTLQEAYYDCRRSVSWKTAVQKYRLNLLSNIVETHNQLESNTYELAKPFEFIISERGRTRYVKSVQIFDRVVQRAFNNNVINPIVDKLAIYDNAASQVGKGVTFARDRFKRHLRNAYNKWGYDCYVLFIDFSKFFDNILHSEALNQFGQYMTPEEYNFLETTFRTFDVDVSFLSDEEYLIYRDELFNMLEYSETTKDIKQLLTGEKMMHKSVGIGNQTSQAVGIIYPHQIDNYVTCVRGYGNYGRYMDDIHIFAKTKEELIDLLNSINEICTPLGIYINYKKTRIQPISTIMTYLKINYHINETGRILETIPSKTIRRERNRIKKFYKLYKANLIDIVDVVQWYLSWYGTYIKFDSKKKMMELDHYFKDLFCFGVYDTDLSEWLQMIHKYNKNNRVENVKKGSF